MKPIEKLIEQEIRRLVKESPNNIYRVPLAGGCSYVEGTCVNGAVGCLLGQALLNVGINKEILQVKSTTVINELLDSFMQTSFYFTDWCVTLQYEQDTGHKWKDALRNADRKVPFLLTGEA